MKLILAIAGVELEISPAGFWAVTAELPTTRVLLGRVAQPRLNTAHEGAPSKLGLGGGFRR
jgi:hypothetical protein